MAMERTTKRVSGDVLDAEGNVDIRDVPGKPKVTVRDGSVILTVTGSKDGYDADAEIVMKPTVALAVSMALMDAAGRA